MADNPTENNTPEEPTAEAPATEAPAKTDAPAAEKKPEEGGGRDNRGGRGNRRGGRPQRQAPPKPMTDDGKELTEKVVFINRCAKVVTKGGRRFSFSALDGIRRQGRPGWRWFWQGSRKWPSVSARVREDAKRSLVRMKIVDGTIPHEIQAEHGGGVVLLKPAMPRNRYHCRWWRPRRL